MKRWLPSTARLALPALYAVAALLVLANFDFGFKPTADQRQFAMFVHTQPWQAWLADSYAHAQWQGRVGHVLALFLNYIGAFLSDMWFYPALCIGILAAIVTGFFVWVQQLSGQRVAVPLTAIYLALLPLGLNHWMPNAYAMQYLPLAVGIWARVALLRYRDMPLPLAGPMLVLVFAGAISFELCTAVMVAMTLGEGLIRYAGGRERVSAAYLVQQVAVVVLAIGVYVAWRLANPSVYAGNQLPTDGILPILQSIAGHLLTAPAIPFWSFGRVGELGPLAWLTPLIVGPAAGIAVWRQQPEAAGARMWLTIAAILAAGAVVPIAANAKYVDWCVNHGQCAYSEGRITLLAVALVLLFGVGLLRSRRAWAAFAVLIGVAGGITHLSNLNARLWLAPLTAPDAAAQRHVCTHPVPSAGDQLLAQQLARVDVPFHLEVGDPARVAYWIDYMGHLRRTPLWLCPAEPEAAD